MPTLVVFDDAPALLGPMTDLRASFDVRTGASTTLERIERAAGTKAQSLLVHPDLAPLTRETHSGAGVNALPAGDDVLLVNGRCVLPGGAIGALKAGEAAVEKEGRSVVAARVGRADAERFAAGFALPATTRATELPERALLRHPADVIRFRDRALDEDLRALGMTGSAALPSGVTRIGAHAVTIAASAKLYPTCVLDAETGPIVIDEGAIVRPLAVIAGPAYIGKNVTIIDRAHIKAHTAIGPTCKVGGEVGGTIIQGLSNKSHDGHLGDSWLGEWVNLGAGTTNSNLLNTYGEVTMRASSDAPMERTGLTFLGAVIGDHVKCAILTRFMTGSVIGTGSMIASAAAPPTGVDRFAWITDAGMQKYKLDRFLDVARAVMARRKMTPSEACVARLRTLHERTPSARAR